MIVTRRVLRSFAREICLLFTFLLMTDSQLLKVLDLRTQVFCSAIFFVSSNCLLKKSPALIGKEVSHNGINGGGVSGDDAESDDDGDGEDGDGSDGVVDHDRQCIERYILLLNSFNRAIWRL